MDGCINSFKQGWETYRHVRTTFLLATVLLIGVLIFSHRIIDHDILDFKSLKQKRPTKNYESLIVCPPNATRRCPPSPTAVGENESERESDEAKSPTAVGENESERESNEAKSPSCPDYFRWIHEDLQPWKATGITKEMVERAKKTANFRLVVLKGKAYVEMFHGGFQTRDIYTLWGILQLLRFYPNRLPDLELMFDLGDKPIVLSSDYKGKDALAPPPLFHYCADDQTVDIPFPDWSFWGWPEINMKSWVPLLKDLKEGNKKMKWMKRKPYAFWKGNPSTSPKRGDLLKCNPSWTQDWNARIYTLDWGRETRRGFKESNVASQCTHRYKIYVEGQSWSVSDKFILACDSPTLMLTPRYHDFFTRGLMPLQHFWPINETDKCRSIKFAVDWGNTHVDQAQEIGKAGSNFIYEQLKMEYVYDYMFHLLTEYSKLLTFKPTLSESTVEYCLESMACHESGLRRKLLEESMVKEPKYSSPCSLPPPFSPADIQGLFKRQANITKQVEIWKIENNNP